MLCPPDVAPPVLSERSAKETTPEVKVARSCQDICEPDGHCFPCGEEENEERSVGLITHPCPTICNEEGECGCEEDIEKRGVGPVNHPCPEICNEEGHCGCEYAPAL